MPRNTKLPGFQGTVEIHPLVSNFCFIRQIFTEKQHRVAAYPSPLEVEVRLPGSGSKQIGLEASSGPQ